jgi:hypothetical protein
MGVAITSFAIYFVIKKVRNRWLQKDKSLVLDLQVLQLLC